MEKPNNFKSLGMLLRYYFDVFRLKQGKDGSSWKSSKKRTYQIKRAQISMAPSSGEL